MWVLRTQSEMGMRWCRQAVLRCWATRGMRLRWVLPRCRQMPSDAVLNESGGEVLVTEVDTVNKSVGILF